MMRGAKQALDHTLSLLRLFLIFIVVLFIPRLGMLYMQTRAQANAVNATASFKLGVENITDSFLKSLSSRGTLSYRVGLITNQSGRDQAGKRTLDILISHGLKVRKIFVPEHGIEGMAQGGEMRPVDSVTKIPLISLFEKLEQRKLDAKMLADIDVLIFDIQEMGMRHNTYLTTLFQAIEAAALYKKKIVVLDRPNVLGSCMEGPLVDDELKSMISYISIPVRHGMTVGELALYFNEHYLHNKADVEMVPMVNYNRYQTAESFLGVRLSPNISTINSCYGYSFLGLLAEVRPFDVAVGTDKAFQCILLPDSVNFPQKNWCTLHAMLKDCGVDASFYRFFSARKKQYCSGLRLRISDMNSFSAFKSLMVVLSFFKKMGVPLEFSKHFDKAVGTRKVREFLEGSISKQELESTINTVLFEFFNKASSVFKYRPYPYLMNL